MPAFEKLVFLLASFIALADAQMYNTTTTSSNAAYQIGIWSGIVLLLALMMSIKMVGAIDYSNDILIICNTGEKEA